MEYLKCLSRRHPGVCGNKEHDIVDFVQQASSANVVKNHTSAAITLKKQRVERSEHWRSNLNVRRFDVRVAQQTFLSFRKS